MSFNRNFRVAVAALATGALIATGAASAPASPTGTGDAQAVAAKKGKKGKVHKAWPHKKDGKKPHSKLARRLAKQVGPVKLKKHHKRSAGLSLREAPALRATGTSPGVVGTTDGSGNKLWLVRSFNIPPKDPLYADLTNYSWTYDNALATIGFVADKDRSQARQLLDQLALLQNKNGSFNFAFDVATGASSEVVRSGAVAWVGLAGTAFADKYGDKSYDAMVGSTIDYLLSQRNAAGLITGGSGVSWASTQHNLLAAELLREAEALTKGSHKFGSCTAATLAAARKDLEAAIDKNLYVTDSATRGHFREGQDDNRIPIDVQALGGMYFDSRKDARAEPRSAGTSPSGPASTSRRARRTAAVEQGQRHEAVPRPGSPNLIWSEGTIESQMAMTRLGSPETFLEASVESLKETMEPDTVGPIGADRDSDSDWGQYRTWPTSAAASWLLMDELEEKVYLFQP